MNKQSLRWVTIIFPVGFLAITFILSDLLVSRTVHLGNLAIVLAVVSIGAVVFSNWVFAQLSEREKEIQKRAAQLEALNLSGLSLITELDMGIVLQKVVDLSRELVGARFGALGVIDPESKSYQQFITSGVTDPQRKSIGHPPRGMGIFGKMIEEGEPLLLDNLAEDESAYGFPSHHPEMNSLIGVPIKTKGKVIGNLYLTEKSDPFNPNSGDRHKFDEEDLRILELFATQAAIAIENARLYRQVQQLAVLEERQRFGMDLHDGVIQSIYAVGLMLEDIQRRVKNDPDAAADGITTAGESLNTAIRDIRNYILDLRPQHFQGRNIVQGMEELARALRANTFMDVNLEITDVDSDWISPEKTVEILHIAQEALANVQKHAQASQVDIGLRFLNGRLHLEIFDNGITIRSQDLHTKVGNGLVNMQERAASLEGEITIGPRLEGGTEVCLTVPIN
jgi:signal transduction histidine kinase